MFENTTIEKVSAFITRPTTTGTELLVFHHAHSGVQIPAGTVEIGEPPEQTALREIYEEAGLQSVRLVCKLATQVQDLSHGESVLLQTTPYFSQPSSGASDPVGEFRRAHWVDRKQVSGDWSQVAEESWDVDAEPAVLLKSATGWIPSYLLATHLVRHFYHAELLEEAPDRWEQDNVEGRYLFRLYWVPLSPRPRLVVGQDEWLVDFYDQLLLSTLDLR
ncbi:MAG TPA: NUDIX domain-containing protein [Ktedonosporobacter sp.]|nr:NUDIX domain-containing protein [Ktedonosporobacter sp.]